ncbi:MAG TPA: hypothetical protein VNS88_14930 [Nitrospiraceae bacterium]|nr:hypothetical protein [Nitrospiraceae bacterium]
MSSVLRRRVLGVSGAILAAIGVIGVAGTLCLRISEGRGAEAVQNGYGQYQTWAAYAGCLIAGGLILLSSYLVRCWQLWRRSRLEGTSMRQVAKELKRSD